MGEIRYDFLPLKVLWKYFSMDNRNAFSSDAEEIFYFLESFRETDDTEYLYLILNTAWVWMFDSSNIKMFTEVSKYFEEFYKENRSDSWKLIPEYEFVSNAVKYLVLWDENIGDEDKTMRNRSIFIWNILCLIWIKDFKEA